MNNYPREYKGKVKLNGESDADDDSNLADSISRAARKNSKLASRVIDQSRWAMEKFLPYKSQKMAFSGLFAARDTHTGM